MAGWLSNLILEVLIAEGNPSDADLTSAILIPQKEIYGRYPLKFCFNGEYASMAI